MPIAAGVEFLEEPLAVFGLLLMSGALVAGLAQRSFLSLTAAFVVAGFILGPDGSRCSTSIRRRASSKASRWSHWCSSCSATG